MLVCSAITIARANVRVGPHAGGAPLALYAQRFSPDRFAMSAGLHMRVGTLGTLLATAPLAYARLDRTSPDPAWPR